MTSFGHITTLDVYQLAAHPHVGVLYFEQFEPSDGTDFTTYINGMSSTLFTGLTKLKEAGVKHVLIDNTGNRGGFIFAGAVALVSLYLKAIEEQCADDAIEVVSFPDGSVSRVPGCSA